MGLATNFLKYMKPAVPPKSTPQKHNIINDIRDSSPMISSNSNTSNNVPKYAPIAMHMKGVKRGYLSTNPELQYETLLSLLEKMACRILST